MIRAGRDSGSRIRKKNLSLVAPSTTAASSSSPGIARMNGRKMMIVIGSENAASAGPRRASCRAGWTGSSSRYSGSEATFDREQQRRSRRPCTRPHGRGSCTGTARTLPSSPARPRGRGHHRDQRAVAEVLPEGRRRQDRLVVLPDPGMRQAGRRVVDLRGGPEPADDHVQHRHQRDRDDHQGDQVAERNRGPDRRCRRRGGAGADRTASAAAATADHPTALVSAPSVSRRSANRWYRNANTKLIDEQEDRDRAAVAELQAAGNRRRSCR